MLFLLAWMINFVLKISSMFVRPTCYSGGCLQELEIKLENCNYFGSTPALIASLP